MNGVDLSQVQMAKDFKKMELDAQREMTIRQQDKNMALAMTQLAVNILTSEHRPSDTTLTNAASALATAGFEQALVAIEMPSARETVARV